MMGMTIDESLEWIISRKEHYEMDDSCQELAQALDTAISTMRKYQKIEQIVNSSPDCIHHTDMDIYKLNSIKEVIEDV